MRFCQPSGDAAVAGARTAFGAAGLDRQSDPVPLFPTVFLF